MTQTQANAALLRSNLCRQEQLVSPVFQEWVVRMHETPNWPHRKIWEYCYIAQALFERGMLAPGKRGLGFAVGQEPLTALFVNAGCDILATDLAAEEAKKQDWISSAQHADSIDKLNLRNLADPEVFRQHVTFRAVDMRLLPDDLGTFDFIWSSCSLEHLGALELGEKYIYEAMKYVRPGGWAVHTTEYNVSSNTTTVNTGDVVLYRRRDIERIAERLKANGHAVDLDLTDGTLPEDQMVDMPPYKQDVHLKLMFGEYVATSIGLIIHKAA